MSPVPIDCRSAEGADRMRFGEDSFIASWTTNCDKAAVSYTNTKNDQYYYNSLLLGNSDQTLSDCYERTVCYSATAIKDHQTDTNEQSATRQQWSNTVRLLRTNSLLLGNSDQRLSDCYERTVCYSATAIKDHQTVTNEQQCFFQLAQCLGLVVGCCDLLLRYHLYRLTRTIYCEYPVICRSFSVAGPNICNWLMPLQPRRFLNLNGGLRHIFFSYIPTLPSRPHSFTTWLLS